MTEPANAALRGEHVNTPDDGVTETSALPVIPRARRRTDSARMDASSVEIDYLGVVDYEHARGVQRDIATERAAGQGRDHLLLLEHPPVYTAGRRTEPRDMPTDGSPVILTDRGGKITWHGPGQLIGYPIVRLAEPVDVIDYVRRLEEALIAVCTDLGLVCGRIPGRSGVWVPANSLQPARKVAAIGVRVERGVALHGVSLNCDSSLDAYDVIVPCGIRDAWVTTLSRELGREITVAEVLAAVADSIVRALDGRLPVSDHDIAHVTPAGAAPGA